jgi:Tfp pilus assembly protein PilX
MRNARSRFHHPARRGAAAVLAMLFLVLMTTLCVAMFSSATLNIQSAANLTDLDRARAAAESGMRWQQYRIEQLRPRSTVGNLTASDATSLWSELRTAILNDYAALPWPGVGAVNSTVDRIEMAGMTYDAGGARYAITIEKLPEYITNRDDPSYRHFIRITSTGIVNPDTARETRRSISMVYTLDKKVRYAIIGKVPIQLGRNTLVEGPVAMATANKFPPLLSLSDFKHLKPSLTTRVNAFEAFLKSRPGNFDNRVHYTEAADYEAALSAGFSDVNGDFFIDEYDLFLAEFDSDADGAISLAEFTDPATNQPYDLNLFQAIDELGAPQYDGQAVRPGYADGVIDNNDLYAKISGQIKLATTSTAWQNNLGSTRQIGDMIGGSVGGDGAGIAPVKFGAGSNDFFDLSPANFDTSAFLNRTGPAAGTPRKTATLIENWSVTAADANGGTVTERTPYGSTSFQATYRRPVFRNITFRNVRIPKGLNALFENCTFEGVTYIDCETNITKSNGQTTTSPTDAMTWSKRMISGSFSASTTLTSSNSRGFNDGNNIRFHGCTFNGPLASSVPTAYSHFTNSWEFTGATRFDNKVDATATIIAPQTNIEMGSFTNPDDAPSTLVGVVVAGNIDIRGTSIVDGSIIVTGDGAGNTTLGWFGASDSATDPSAMPEGGFGRLSIRYNPHRALPDGINVRVDILPDVKTYTETLGQ